MIQRTDMDLSNIIAGYDLHNTVIGTLGGHSALDICHGAKRHGFQTVCVAKKGREKTYGTYFRTASGHGCVDKTIVVNEFSDVLDVAVQQKLRDMNTIFIQSRYFWVYLTDYSRLENNFNIPIFGNRSYVKIEERNQQYNQYHLLRDAGVRIPKVFERPQDIDRPVIVKANERERGYERAFFVVASKDEWESEGSRLEESGRISADWRSAAIEEFVVGAHVNFNFFYSPLSNTLELMGTDARRQTNLDGFLRMPCKQQQNALKYVDLKMIETGHMAITVKESLLEKAFDIGEKFVEETRKIDDKGIIGPFALQGAVVAEEGKESIIIFDVSMRIPGSPGTRFTPYSGYLHGEPISYGERIAMEIKEAIASGRLEDIVT